jgi:hypothetical protein
MCSPRDAQLLVSAEGPRRIRLVRFYDSDRLIATDRTATAGSLFGTSARLGRASRHRLRAVAIDASGGQSVATRTVSLCG